VQNFCPHEVARRRKALELTRTELAMRVRRSEQTVIKWELGQVTPRPEQIGVLAAALDCQPGDLFADDGRPDLALEYLRAQDRGRGVPEHVTDRRALEDGAALLASTAGTATTK
jgi:transcriptional regulator with XRE-family HTH domain